VVGDSAAAFSGPYSTPFEPKKRLQVPKTRQVMPEKRPWRVAALSGATKDGACDCRNKCVVINKGQCYSGTR